MNPPVEVVNPATGDVVGAIAWGGRPEARAAIERAQEALPGWRATSALERGRALRRFSDRMLRDQERLARLLTSEQGKPLAEARGEIAYAASFLEWSAGEAERIYGEIVPARRANQRILVLRQAIGVCAAITPWNFPSAMITRKLGPALAAGCTMVVKPAEQTPLSALALVGLAREAGIPDGAFEVVCGEPVSIADELLENPAVRMLSFTGSTEVGQSLMRKAATNVTRLSLELGGHAPFIVFDDADLEKAVAGAMASKFRNMGQTCICPNRFFVQDGIYDAFADALSAAANGLVAGDGLDDGVTLGPLIDDEAMAKVERHVADAIAKGATLRSGGGRLAMGPGRPERWYQPTVLDGVTDSMLCARDETFGPVAPLMRFSTEEEAVRRANDTRYGLAAYFYTRDIGRVMRVAEALEYGIVGANDGAPSTAQAPFGGHKQSGLGREGGHWAMDEYLEVKYVSLLI